MERYIGSFIGGNRVLVVGGRKYNIPTPTNKQQTTKNNKNKQTLTSIHIHAQVERVECLFHEPTLNSPSRTQQQQQHELGTLNEHRKKETSSRTSRGEKKTPTDKQPKTTKTNK